VQAGPLRHLLPDGAAGRRRGLQRQGRRLRRTRGRAGHQLDRRRVLQGRAARVREPERRVLGHTEAGVPLLGRRVGRLRRPRVLGAGAGVPVRDGDLVRREGQRLQRRGRRGLRDGAARRQPGVRRGQDVRHGRVLRRHLGVHGGPQGDLLPDGGECRPRGLQREGRRLRRPDGRLRRYDQVNGFFVWDQPICENQLGVCAGALKPAALCVGGSWKACGDAQYSAHSSSYQPGIEMSCDELDNDCNGETDEDFSVTMLDGRQISGINKACGVGACKAASRPARKTTPGSTVRPRPGRPTRSATTSTTTATATRTPSTRTTW